MTKLADHSRVDGCIGRGGIITSAAKIGLIELALGAAPRVVVHSAVDTAVYRLFARRLRRGFQ